MTEPEVISNLERFIQLKAKMTNLESTNDRLSDEKGSLILKVQELEKTNQDLTEKVTTLETKIQELEKVNSEGLNKSEKDNQAFNEEIQRLMAEAENLLNKPNS